MAWILLWGLPYSSYSELVSPERAVTSFVKIRIVMPAFHCPSFHNKASQTAVVTATETSMHCVHESGVWLCLGGGPLISRGSPGEAWPGLEAAEASRTPAASVLSVLSGSRLQHAHGLSVGAPGFLSMAASCTVNVSGAQRETGSILVASPQRSHGFTSAFTEIA